MQCYIAVCIAITIEISVIYDNLVLDYGSLPLRHDGLVHLQWIKSELVNEGEY